MANFIEIIQRCVLSSLKNFARAQLAWKQLTLRNHLNLYELVTLFHGYHEVANDNVQRQFVYFIVTIWCNTLKSFISCS